MIMSIIALFTVKKLPKTVDDFFTANGSLDETSFVDTSVAYAYQIAAISLFAYWGFEYGIWTVWVPIFWGIGFSILAYYTKKGFVTKFVEGNNGDTIHGLLMNHYKVKTIAILAGIASMLGLAGTAFFEAEFTANIAANLINSDGSISNNANSYSIWIFISFVLVALFYIIIGGQRAIVKTDSIQLKVGFTLFMSFLGGVIGITYAKGFIFSSVLFFILCLILVGILMYLYNNLSKSMFNGKRFNTTFIIGVVVFIIFFFIGMNIQNTESITSNDNLAFFLQTNQFSNVFILGFPALISLLIANASWQLVDVSNWQRISSIRNIDNFKDKLYSTLKYIGLYSPITWVLAIILGMTLKMLLAGSTDSYNSLSNAMVYLLQSNDAFSNILSLLMLGCMTLIMFSTLDSLILAISFTVQKDIFNLKETNIESNIIKFKLGTIVTTLLLFVFYIFSRIYIANIDSILYTFYSFQIGLLPAIFFALTSKSTNKYAAIGSIIIGLATPILVFVFGLSPYDWTALITFIFTIVAFLVLNMFKSNSSK